MGDVNILAAGQNLRYLLGDDHIPPYHNLSLNAFGILTWQSGVLTRSLITMDKSGDLDVSFLQAWDMAHLPQKTTYEPLIAIELVGRSLFDFLDHPGLPTSKVPESACSPSSFAWGTFW